MCRRVDEGTALIREDGSEWMGRTLAEYIHQNNNNNSNNSNNNSIKGVLHLPVTGAHTRTEPSSPPVHTAPPSLVKQPHVTPETSVKMTRNEIERERGGGRIGHVV